MNFVKDTLTTFSTQIISVILGLAVTIIIARVLGPSGKGAYTLIILVPIILATFGNLGIGVANAYFAGKRKYELKEIASNSLIAALGLGLFLVIVSLTSLSYFQLSFLEDIEPQYLSIAIFALPFFLLMIYFSHILLGENKINMYNAVRLSQNVALVIFLCLFLFAVNKGVLGAILAWSLAVLTSGILSILLVRRLTKIGWSFHLPLFRDSIKFGIRGYVGTVINILNYRLDMILISFFMGVTFVGYYSVAVNLAEALWYFPSAVGTVLFSRTPRVTAEEANASTPRICRNTICLTLLAAISLFIFSKVIINILFGSSFLPALKPLWILLPGIVTLSITKVLSNELIGRGKPIIGSIGAAVSLALNIPLNLFLIPLWGISGAALASTISYSAATIVVLIAFLRVSQNSLFDTVIIKRRDLEIYTNLFINWKTFVVSKLLGAFNKKI